MADPSLSFCQGETVLALHDRLIYEAKVKKVEIRNPTENTKEYFIHYQGWNKAWDEWVGIERLLKFTEENRKLMDELKLENRKRMDERTLEQLDMEKNPKSECLSNMKPKSSTEENKKLMEELKPEQPDIEKNPKSECVSNMKPKSSTVGKGKKRTSDLSVEKQTRYDAAYENLKPLGFRNKKIIRTKIDSLLKVYGGGEGWAFIEEASYKLLIECLLEGQEQLHLKDKEEENQGILLLKEEEVQETDEQLLRKKSRKKIRRLSSVAGTSIAVDMYEPTGSELRTEEVRESIEETKYLMPAAQRERLQERLGDGDCNGNGNGKLVSARQPKSQENLTGSVLGTSQCRRKRPSFGFIDSTDDGEEDYVFFDTKPLLL